MEVLRKEINRKEEDQADLQQKKEENDYMLNEENQESLKTIAEQQMNLHGENERQL